MMTQGLQFLDRPLQRDDRSDWKTDLCPCVLRPSNNNNNNNNNRMCIAQVMYVE